MGGVGGREEGARERGGERTGRDSLGAGRPEIGRSGGENTGMLGGDVSVYGIYCRRREVGRTSIRFRTYNI